MTKRVFILGAGASRECLSEESEDGQFRSPLSKDFFELLERVHGENPAGIRVANIEGYVMETRGSYGTEDGPFRTDIEAFMTEVEEKASAGLKNGTSSSPEEFMAWMSAKMARDELIESLPIALNRVQWGPTCPHYQRFVSALEPTDAVVTFNWDVSLDRALHETRRWFPDDGYSVSFLKVFEEGWRDPIETRSEFQYFKLHGSVNWLVGWMSYDRDGLVTIAQPEGEIRPVCFVGGSQPYEIWREGERRAVEPFTYAHAPKHPVYGVPTMAALIPPVHNKLYGAFADFLQPVWDGAASALAEASEWVIAGYSFPKTDETVSELLRNTHGSAKRITVVEPVAAPEDTAARVRAALRQDSDIRVVSEGFAAFVDAMLHR